MTDLDPDEFRRLGHAVVDWVAAYRAGLADRPVRPEVAPVRFARGCRTCSRRTRSRSAMLGTLDGVVAPANLHWQHPAFFGYFPANAALASLLGGLLSGGLGSQGMLWSTAPAGTEMEQALLDGLASAIGLGPEFTVAGGGGGRSPTPRRPPRSSRCSRPCTAPRTAGGARRASTAASESTSPPRRTRHGTRRRAWPAEAGRPRAARRRLLAGHGRDVARGAAQQLHDDVAAGLRPVLGCPTIGTTGTGTIDPVRAVATLAREHRAWCASTPPGVAACPRRHRDRTSRLAGYCTNAQQVAAHRVRRLAALGPQPCPPRCRSPRSTCVTPRERLGCVVDYRDWQVSLGRRFGR